MLAEVRQRVLRGDERSQNGECEQAQAKLAPPLPPRDHCRHHGHTAARLDAAWIAPVAAIFRELPEFAGWCPRRAGARR
jgi:hypothetical protein